MMKKLMKRTLAVVLALTMCVSMLSLNAFAAAAGDTCPECGKGTIVTDKGNPNHLICTDCAKFSEYIQDTKPTCAHEKTYLKDNGNGTTHILICSICDQQVGTEKHDFGDDGKCKCGAQEPVHEHSWTYKPDYLNEFTHVKTCSTCGVTVTEACTTHEVNNPWNGKVKECTLCGYWSPVSDVHNWAEEWEPDGNGHHTLACTDDGCVATRTEECELKATNGGAVVSCTVCGWVKYNDGTPGDGSDGNECPNGEHSYGTIGTSSGEGSHKRTCMDCGHVETEQCEWSILKEDGKLVAHYCTVCGNWKSIRDDGDGQYCEDQKDHVWGTTKEVLSEDGQSVLTTLTCSKCGAVKITNICNSPAKVTVRYVYEDGKTAHADKTQTVIAGMYYKIESPEISGYVPDATVITGTCTDGKGTEYTVTYKKVDTYTLTIEYFLDGENTPFSTYTKTLENGELYEVISPDKTSEGYELAAGAQDAVKKGEINGKDVYYHVDYKPIEYTWTINYVDEKGNPMEDLESVITKFDVTTIKTLESVTSPAVTGYSASESAVNAPTNLGDVTNTVVYKPSTDFQLTVIHRYVALNGVVTEEKQESGKAYKIGDEYTTTARSRAGYTLSATPDNANGTFGAEDVTVVYVYNAVAPTTPVVPNPPVVTDPPVVEVEDPDVPLVEQPDVPDEVEIEEPDVPLTELPDEIEIEEPDVPLAELPVEIEIEEPDVPLADVPRTGDNSQIWVVFALVSGAGLVWLTLDGKKSKATEE